MYAVESGSDSVVREGAQTNAPERTPALSLVLREPFRRNLKMPGMTFSVVVSAVSGGIIDPDYEERSGSGAHGEDVYVLNEPAYVLRFNRSNSGKIEWAVFLVELDGKQKRVRFADLPKMVKFMFAAAVKNRAKVPLMTEHEVPLDE